MTGTARSVRAAVVALGGLVAGVGCASDGGGPTLSGEAGRGQQVAAQNGCAGCHSADGSTGVGPSWKDSWGQQVALEDGSSVTFDAAYLERSLREPGAQRRAGTRGQMPVYDTSRIDESELAALAAYLQALAPTP